MVRLKEFNEMKARYDELSFNSTMVRLKAMQCLSFPTSSPNFQFHYGTIKSTEEEANAILRSLFQFHYGTIKSIITTM